MAASGDRTFGAAASGVPRITLLRPEPEIPDIHLRLTNVTIEHLPWQKLIKTYDCTGTLFYLDPLYHKAPYYKHNFKLADFQELSQTLASLKSYFIRSINDHPVMRNVFSSFRQKTVQLNYSAPKANRQNPRNC